MTEIEKSAERTGVYIARLGDLGLGNPEGIPSAYAEASDAELAELAAKYTERLVAVEDLTACACIDGRHTNCNADGSPAVLRLRRVGGSASNFGVALNAGAAVLDSFSPDDTLGHRIHLVDAAVAEGTGFGRSAHLGGCGGANGEIQDNIAIAENPAVLNTVKAIMGIPDVAAYVGVKFDDDAAEIVRADAANTAKILQEHNWDGQTYVDGVNAENPAGVEVLEVDANDHAHHGHKENTLTLIIGDETFSGDDDFVWNLKASMMVAKAFAGDRGDIAYVQALIAEMAKHAAVANRLPGVGTPVLLLKSGYALAA